MTLSAALLVSARTTPLPWVPSSNLMMRGAPPTSLMRSFVSKGESANPVFGIGILSLERSWSERSLSRDLAMAVERLRQ